jgi:uncharacterized membrane protein
MVHSHIQDAWTRSADRSTPAFRTLTIVGGMAAPLFLFLAGVALALAADRRPASDRHETGAAIVKRGLEIFILAFLFRLQAFLISSRDQPLVLFRVDILNIMGLGIVMAGLVWTVGRSRVRTALMFAALASLTALVTPLVRQAGWVAWLPIWIQWYVRPMGEDTTFTGLPWWGFVFAGVVAGLLIAGGTRGAARTSHDRTHLVLGASGLALVGLGLFAAHQPSPYTSSSFWTSSPAYFAIRTGIVTLTLTLLYAFARVAGEPAWMAPLARLGQSSLFVYLDPCRAGVRRVCRRRARPSALLGSRVGVPGLCRGDLLRGCAQGHTDDRVAKNRAGWAYDQQPAKNRLSGRPLAL